MSITAAPDVAGLAGEWRADPVHSNVGFAVRHMVVSTFRGRFERYEAALRAGADGVALTGSVDVDSIVLKNPDLATHLRSPEFFDVERHPQLTFASTAVTVAGGSIVVDGDLTIRGVTRPVRAQGVIEGPVDDPYGDVRMAIRLETGVDRREFGLDWNMALPKGGYALGNDVTLLIDLEFIKA